MSSHEAAANPEPSSKPADDSLPAPDPVDSSEVFTLLTQVSNLPMVRCVLSYTIQKYSDLKTAHAYTKLVAETVEGSVQFTADNIVQPVINSCRKPLIILDHTATKALKVAENWIPIIKVTPEQVAQVYQDTILRPVNRIKEGVEGQVAIVSSGIGTELIKASNWLDEFMEDIPEDENWLEAAHIEYPATKMSVNLSLGGKIFLFYRKLRVCLIYNIPLLIAFLAVLVLLCFGIPILVSYGLSLNFLEEILEED